MIMTRYPKLTPAVDSLTLMDVWGGLIEAYHGVNGYGGDTAEIYAYTLRRSSVNKMVYREDHLDSVDNLVELCKYFESNYRVKITINECSISTWKKSVIPLDDFHRAHVKVIRKKK